MLALFINVLDVSVVVLKLLCLVASDLTVTDGPLVLVLKQLLFFAVVGEL